MTEGFFSDLTAGGILSTVNNIFGKGSTPPLTGSPTYDPNYGIPKNNTLLLMVAGGAVLFLAFMFLKK